MVAAAVSASVLLMFAPATAAAGERAPVAPLVTPMVGPAVDAPGLELVKKKKKKVVEEDSDEADGVDGCTAGGFLCYKLSSELHEAVDDKLVLSWLLLFFAPLAPLYTQFITLPDNRPSFSGDFLIKGIVVPLVIMLALYALAGVFFVIGCFTVVGFLGTLVFGALGLAYAAYFMPVSWLNHASAAINRGEVDDTEAKPSKKSKKSKKHQDDDDDE